MRRERDAKRVAKSVRSHEATMDAYRKAANWDNYVANTGEFETTRNAVNIKTHEVFTPGQGNVYLRSKYGKNNFAESSGVARQEQTSYRTGLGRGKKNQGKGE